MTKEEFRIVVEGIQAIREKDFDDNIERDITDLKMEEVLKHGRRAVLLDLRDQLDTCAHHLLELHEIIEACSPDSKQNDLANDVKKLAKKMAEAIKNVNSQIKSKKKEGK